MLNGCINKVSRCEIGMMAQISFKRLAATRNNANQPAGPFCDLCPTIVSSYRGLTPVYHSVLNVKVLVGAFSVIVKSSRTFV